MNARYSTTGKQFEYQSNSYGQKIQEKNLKDVYTNYSYSDQWGNLTQVVQDPGTGHLNRTTSMVYDSGGRVLQSSDPMARTSVFGYNNLGQPLTAAFPATPNTPAETVSYGYGGNGRMESVTDNRGTTTLGYENGNDRVSSVTDPVTGAVGYTYRMSGERLTMSLPGGGVWSYNYDVPTVTMQPKDDPNSASRILSKITDDQGRIVNYRLDLRGRLHETYFNQVFDATNALTSYCKTEVREDVGFGYTHGWTAQVKNIFKWINP